MIKKKVLIVDDEKAFRFLISKTLEKAGFEVMTAENGEVAVQKALAEHPEVILMDLYMPHKDGMTAIREIRQDTWGKTANIVVLTNIDYPESMRESKDLHIENYVVKSSQSLKDIAEMVVSLTSAK
jgi:CheY-like chemotaxis protein